MTDDSKPYQDALRQTIQSAMQDYEDGNYAKVEPLFRTAMERLPQDCPELLQCVKGLGEIAAARGQFSEAIRMHLRHLGLLRRLVGGTDDRVLTQMEYVGQLYDKIGRTQEADIMYNGVTSLKEVRDRVDDEYLMEQPEVKDEIDLLYEKIVGKDEEGPGSASWILSAHDHMKAQLGEGAQPEQAPELFQQIDMNPTKWEDSPDAQQYFSAPEAEEQSGFKPPPQAPPARPASRPAATGESKDAAKSAPTASPTGGGGSRPSAAAQAPNPPQMQPGLEPNLNAPRPSGADDNPFASPPSRRNRANQTADLPAIKPRRVAVSPPGPADAPAGGAAPPPPNILRGGKSRQGGPSFFAGLLSKLQDMMRPQRSSPHVQQKQSGPKQQANALLTGFMLIAMLIVGFIGAYKFMPRKITPQQAFEQMPHGYRSAAGDKNFFLSDLHSCEFNTGDKDKTVHFVYDMYLDDWRDLVRAAMLGTSQKQYWYLSEPQGLVDQDGTMLYVDPGPVTKLTTEMESISQFLNAYFQAHKEYPHTLEESGQDFSYSNPYTKSRDMPSFSHISVGDKMDAQQADQARDLFYRKLRYGEGWEGEPRMYPGCINCASVTFLSPRGNIHAFVMQAADGKGKPLRGSKPGWFDYRTFEEGKDEAAEPAKVPFEPPQFLTRPWVAWIVNKDASEGVLFWLQNGGAAIFGGAALFWLLLGASMRGRSGGRAISMLISLMCLIVAMIYAVHSKLP